MRLALEIAFRFLTSNRGQSILIAVGIAIGIAIQIFIGILIQSLQTNLLDITIGRSSHLSIKPVERNGVISDYQDVIDKISRKTSEIKEIAPLFQLPAFIKADSISEQVLINGIDTASTDKIYQYSDTLIQGSLPARSNSIIIGNSLAEKLDVGLSDSLSLTFANGEAHEVYVVGIFDYKVSAVNDSTIVTNIDFLNSIEKTQNACTSIELQVNDPFLANEYSEMIQKTIDINKYKTSNWKDENEQLLSGLSGQSISSFIIQFFVIISVILGISSVLSISVLQKSKQLGILKAMGLNDQSASMIFMFEGLILGISGAIMGIVFGIGLLKLFSNYVVNSEGMPVVPITLEYSFIIFSGVLAIVASLVSSIYPAGRSRRLSPIEVIRNE